MKILVDRLDESPEAFHFEADPAWWREAQARLPELAGVDAGSFHVDVEAHRMGQDVYLEGVIEGRFDLGCGRCLARYGQPLREPFRVAKEFAGDPHEPLPAATPSGNWPSPRTGGKSRRLTPRMLSSLHITAPKTLIYGNIYLFPWNPVKRFGRRYHPEMHKILDSTPILCNMLHMVRFRK